MQIPNPHRREPPSLVENISRRTGRGALPETDQTSFQSLMRTSTLAAPLYMSMQGL